LLIEAVTEQNLEEVLPLIRQYQAFYQVAEISDSTNQNFFSQFGEDNPAGCQFLFRQAGSVVGFATVFFTYTSTITAQVAVLNDLFTLPEARGQGVGRALLEHCREFAASRGAVRLQWVTAPDNQQAQRLYDSLAAKKSNWNFYAYST